MVTEMITVKLEDAFLKAVDSVVKKEGYQNRTEFIRNALREKMEESKMKQAMMAIAHLKGASKKKTTDKQLEALRIKAFASLSKKIK